MNKSVKIFGVIALIAVLNGCSGVFVSPEYDNYDSEVKIDLISTYQKSKISSNEKNIILPSENLRPIMVSENKVVGGRIEYKF